MPTLCRWFEQEYDRLYAEDKAELILSFDAFRRAYFDYDYQSVMQAIPDLYRLAAAFDEPVIRLATDYYRMVAEAYWLGDLSTALDLATASAVRARTMLGWGTILETYLDFNLFFIWLDIDGPGYAPDVLAALGADCADLPRDLALRFELLRAYALMQNGDGQDALTLILATLPELGDDWPQPFRHAMRGDALAGVGRLEEALADYRLAMRGFGSLGHFIEATAIHISIGGTLVRLGNAAQGLKTLHAAYSAATHSLNQAHVGQAQGEAARALADLGHHRAAIEQYSAALDALEGLGWLRLEAELALERLKIVRQAGANELQEQWEADARRRVHRLRSTDLQHFLAEIDGE